MACPCLLRAYIADAIAASRAESEQSDNDASSESSSVASTIASIVADEEYCLRVDPKSNKHFGAADLETGLCRTCRLSSHGTWWEPHAQRPGRQICSETKLFRKILAYRMRSVAAP